MFTPTLGRWLQEDPSLFEGDDVNLYRGLDNDPINLSDPYGLEGKVTSVTIEIQAGTEPKAKASGFDLSFLISINGQDLGSLEYTQFITHTPEGWGDDGKQLSQSDLLGDYAVSQISLKDLPPFKKMQDPVGWGDKDKWVQFTENQIKFGKGVHLDHQVGKTPSYEHPFNGATFLAMRNTREMEVQIRECKTKKIVFTHDWSFTFQNFPGDEANAKKVKVADSGFYKHAGIVKMPFDKSTPAKK